MFNSPTEASAEFAVVLLDSEGVIVDAQPNCSALLGWTREELIGQDVGVLLKTGKDLIVEQLINSQLPDAEKSGNTSFSVKVLGKRKDKSQFPARVSVRPFAQVNCWTVAFYSHVSAIDSETPPAVSPEEIELVTRALQEKGAEIPRNEGGMSSAASPKKAMTGENALWRTAKLLVRSRKEQPAPPPPPPEEVEPEIQAMPEWVEDSQPAPEAVQEQVQKEKLIEHEELPPQEQIPEETEFHEVQSLPQFQPAEHSEMVLEESTIISLEQHARQEEECQPEVKQHEVVAKKASETTHFERQDASAATSDNTAELVRLRSEFERERGLRVRAEQRAASLNTQFQTLNVQLNETLAAESANSIRIAELENELEVSQQLLAEERAQFEKVSMERGAAEEQSQMLKELNGQLEASMASFEECNRLLEQENEELQRQLQAGQDALKESELAREGEMKKRQEMELRMTTAVREQQDAENRSKADVAKAESALRATELKCKRLEADLLRARAQATEQERLATRRTEEFRTRLREPVSNLNQTACHLLQSGLPEDQKQLMEIMLREVLSVENSLRERIPSAPEAN